MSLLEVMIAIGLLSVVSIGVMTLTKNMSKSSRTASKATELEAVMREIQTNLAQKAICDATVFGAASIGNTLLTGIKQLNRDGQVVAHPRLRVSTPSKPVYFASGMIINGMVLRPRENYSDGVNAELIITIMKSVRASIAGSPAQDASYGPNIVRKVISLQLDNCERWVAAGPTAQRAMEQCRAMGAQAETVGPAILMKDNVFEPAYFQACKNCAIRTTVNGCIK